MPAYKEPARPPRPALPFTFWALIAVIFIEQAVLRGGWGMNRCIDAAVMLVLAGGGLAAVLGLWGRLGAARFSAFLVLSLCTGMLVASMGVETGRAAVAALQENPISAWSFSISGDARYANGKYRMRARASLGGRTSTDVWLYADEPLYPGQMVRGVGRLKPLGDGAWAEASRAQGVNASVSLVKVQGLEARGGLLGAMDSLRRRLVESIAPDKGAARAFIAACVTGDRSGLDALNMNGDLRRCGVSHLVAVSGTHLALVAAAFSSALGAAKTRAKARSIILVIAMGLFVMLCGAPASAARAWIMALVHAASVFANRRSHGLSALCAAAVAMALLDPFVTGQLAYQLSVAAVLGIYLVNPYLRYVLEVLFAPTRTPRFRLPRAWLMRALAAKRALLDLLSLSMTAQLVTLPITTSSFSELSLVAPLANLLASPLIALLTMAGLAVCALLPLPGMQAAVLACADPLGKILVFLLKAIAAFPFAAVPTPAHPLVLSAAVLSLVLALAWFSPKLTRKRIMLPLMGLLSLIAVWFCCNRFLAPARMVVLDVGQGDAILLQEGPYAVLVDAGPEGALDDALMRCSVFHLDAVILSHLHNDHYGGVADLAGHVGCDRLISARGTASHVPDELAGWMHDAHIGGPVEIGYLDTVSFGHFTLTVLAPMVAVDGLENEDSMFLLVRFDDGRRKMSALLTGDGESAELGAVLAQADLAGIDILKVGHHGSENSIAAAQAEQLHPAYALCSAGRDNEFGHPHAGTVKILVDAGSTFICTKDAGDIVIAPTPDGAKLRE